MSINTDKLEAELKSLQGYVGCAFSKPGQKLKGEFGKDRLILPAGDREVGIDFIDEATANASVSSAQAIISAHNPAETRVQKLSKLGLTPLQAAILARASSSWLTDPAGFKAQVQKIIDDAAAMVKRDWVS